MPFETILWLKEIAKVMIANADDNQRLNYLRSMNLSIWEIKLKRIHENEERFLFKKAFANE